jgi:hypothetical protein
MSEGRGAQRHTTACTVVLCLLGFATLIFADAATARTCAPVPSTGLIDKPGRYCLGADLSVDRRIGIEIASPDVVLDLGGFEITKRAKQDDQVSIGVRIEGSSAARGIAVRNGKIRGFTIGVNAQGASGTVMEGLAISAGAIGINTGAADAVLHRNQIRDVGGAPLDANQAYAIGVNLSGRGARLEDNVIGQVYRAARPRSVTGEAVGVLVTSDCSDCVVANNRLENDRVDPGSIGIWNAALGRVDITGNSVTLFERAIYSVGRAYAITGNSLSCGAGYSQSVGVVLVLRHPPEPSAFGAAFNNRIQACLIDTFQCFSDCDPKVRDLLDRLKLSADRAFPGIPK